MKKQNKRTSKRWRASAYGVAFLLMMMAGCDNATSPNQDLTSSYDTPVTVQSGDAMNTTIDEQPIYSVEGFYFLAPMVKDSEFSGTFDAGLSPVVEICETTACDASHAIFDMYGEGSEQVRVEEDDEHYIVNWNTNSSGAEAGQTYRIRVMVAGTTLGHADVAVVTTGREAIEVRSDGLIALVANQTLPIKFRIEEGAVYVTDSSGGTITSEDGHVTLKIPENAIDGSIGITISSVIDDLDDEDVVPGALFDFGPSPFTFNEPVMLTITFDPANLPDGVSEDELRLLAVVDGEWVQLPGSSVNLLNSTVTGPINSFSRKGVGRGKVSAIAVTPADASIEVGDTQQFEATVTNVDGEEMNRNVRWSSSNEEVATIDNTGLATAVALGESTIEARSGKVTGTADLTVEVAGPVVTTITVSPAEATITEGSTSQFTATVYDQNEEVMEDETVTWSSGDSGIASVDEAGLATGISEGETTIIASIGEVSGSANLVVTAGEESKPFVTRWFTEYPYSWGPTRIGLDMRGAVDATIEWGDGSSTVVTGPGVQFHTYVERGFYTVSISGTVPHLTFDTAHLGASEKAKLIQVVDWGDVGFTSLNYAFAGAVNLTRVPASSRGIEDVTDMSGMFLGASSFNADISGWNTVNVTSMFRMFAGATAFNKDIGQWNTSNVRSMRDMFWSAASFNQNIGGWNTKNVLTMDSMFRGATAFNQDISGWNTEEVTNMYRMFQGASSFNGDIGGWNTSSVRNMSFMFYNALAFNRDIGGWNTSNVTNMQWMFLNASAFNQNIGGWNTENVRRMDLMFNRASAFNQDISGWNTSNVFSMNGMFSGASTFDQNIGGWNTSSVTNMSNMFYFASAFESDISTWDTGNVRSMREMFRGATSFNGDIGGWNTENVSNMWSMFRNSTSFNQDLSRWCVSLITSEPGNFDSDATNWELPRPDWGSCPE